MTLLELLIIYLSIGAPFGVLAFFGANDVSRSRLLVDTVVAVLMWPVILFLRTHRRLTRAVLADDGPDQFRTLDEFLIDRSFTLPERRLLEDHFSLFAAASRSHSSDSSGYKEYLEIAGNPHAPVGAVCLTRRRQRQILERLANSREELYREFGMKIPVSSSRRTSDVAELCTTFGDNYTAERLLEAPFSTSLPATSQPLPAKVVS